jgi:hypothetical protein
MRCVASGRWHKETPLIRRGGRWTAQPYTPIFGRDGLGPISCPDAKHCVALRPGDGRILSWGGMAWQRDVIARSATVGLYDVACSSALHCVVVGGSGTATALARRDLPPGRSS